MNTNATILETARGLFDTDSAGTITNTDDVHPEYMRAVIELATRLTVDMSTDDDAYNTTAAVLGLPAHDSLTGARA